ncbi:hypothetical protein F8178_02715 [Haloechinothrix sp. LS1_15]|nr:hypothetical protein [Haloechinothrix sp. LS1_15]
MHTGTDPVRELAERIADAVDSHPAVAGLHRGPDRRVATHLPGGPVEGVRCTGAGDPVEVCLVAYLGDSLVEVSEQVRQYVREAAGDVAVHVTVADVIAAEHPPG